LFTGGPPLRPTGDPAKSSAAGQSQRWRLDGIFQGELLHLAGLMEIRGLMSRPRRTLQSSHQPFPFPFREHSKDRECLSGLRTGTRHRLVSSTARNLLCERVEIGPRTRPYNSFIFSELWRRGWDSNPTGPFRFCKLQILQCQHCRTMPSMPSYLARCCTLALHGLSVFDDLRLARLELVMSHRWAQALNRQFAPHHAAR